MDHALDDPWAPGEAADRLLHNSRGQQPGPPVAFRLRDSSLAPVGADGILAPTSGAAVKGLRAPVAGTYRIQVVVGAPGDESRALHVTLR